MRNKKPNIFRVILCIAMMAAAYVLESCLGARFSIMGVHVDVIPLMVASVGCMLGSGAGMACGIAAGVLYDLGGVAAEGIFPIYYMVWGIGAGLYGEEHPERKLNQILIISTLMMAVMAVLRYLFYFQFNTDSGIVFFAQGLVAQVLLNAVLSPLMYVLVRRVALGKHRNAAPVIGGSDGNS